MGNCNSQQSLDERYLSLRNKAIEKELQEAKKELQELDRNSVKVLLLGAGESGKSTVLKQMKLMNKIEFTDEEIKSFRAAIRLNILTCAKILIIAMDVLRIPYGFEWSLDDAVETSDVHEAVAKIDQAPVTSIRLSHMPPSLQAAIDKSNNGNVMQLNHEGVTPAQENSNGKFGITSIPKVDVPLSATVYHAKKYTWGNDGVFVEVEDETAIRAQEEYMTRTDFTPPDFVDEISSFSLEEGFTPEVIDAIKNLWEDSGVQYCFTRANEYQLMDCCEYIMKHIDRITDFHYKPTEEDILRARIKTTTVTETVIRINGSKVLRVYDVGGQRSERRKWASHFQDVSSIIFLIAISEYNKMCAEDAETNRMVEALNVFGAICSHPYFLQLSIVVFLNKIDLFKERLKHFPICATFPSYKGPNTFEEGCKYFSKRVTDINKAVGRAIYIYFTWATDKEQIRTVLAMVQDILINQNLSDFGLI